MYNNKLITIIVLSYNSMSYIYDSLLSILNQKHQMIELIIADDASVDFDQDKIKKYIESNKKDNLLSYTIFKNIVNLGTVKNLNNAIKHANGDYICVIAADDVFYDNNVFSGFIQRFDQENECELIVGNILSCDAFLNVIENPRATLSNILTARLLRCEPNTIIRTVFRRNLVFIPTQSCCFRKTFFSKHGFYDERYLLMEDLPMMLRIITKQIKISHLNAYVVMHREGTGMSSTKEVISAKSYKYYLDILRFFTEEVSVYGNNVGRSLVSNRIKMYKFRIEYSKALIQKKKIIYKLLLMIKNMFTIFYYLIIVKNRDISNKKLLRKSI